MSVHGSYNLGEYFSALPPEMTAHVLSFLTGWELVQKVALLNRDFSLLVEENFQWRERTIKKFSLEPTGAQRFLEGSSREMFFGASEDQEDFWRSKYIELCHKYLKDTEEACLSRFSAWARVRLLDKIFSQQVTNDKDLMMILVRRPNATYKKAGKYLKKDLDFQGEVRRVHGLRHVAWKAIPRLLLYQLKHHQ